MVIADFDACGAGVSPLEANAELVVDSDAMASPSISSQCFQSVARRNPQFVESNYGIELIKLTLSDAPNRLGAALLRVATVDPIEEILGSTILK